VTRGDTGAIRGAAKPFQTVHQIQLPAERALRSFAAGRLRGGRLRWKLMPHLHRPGYAELVRNIQRRLERRGFADRQRRRQCRYSAGEISVRRKAYRRSLSVCASRSQEISFRRAERTTCAIQERRNAVEERGRKLRCVVVKSPASPIRRTASAGFLRGRFKRIGRHNRHRLFARLFRRQPSPYCTNSALTRPGGITNTQLALTVGIGPELRQRHRSWFIALWDYLANSLLIGLQSLGCPRPAEIFVQFRWCHSCAFFRMKLHE
jgi:hypothetical protein